MLRCLGFSKDEPPTMYSLYRAWLSLGPCGGLPSSMASLPVAPMASPTPLNLTVPAPVQLPGVPDVTLQVGPSLTQFSAHKIVLSAHSGFFKAALANHSGASPISVPNVNVDEFSSLLTFMYTGYLDLNIGNIYSILLATHILHMPRALEICRSFLLQTQTQEQRTNVIKPIPSRKTAPATQEIYSPTFGCLKKSEGTPFKTVSNERDTQKASTSKTEPALEEADSKPGAKLEKQKHKKRTWSNEKVIIDIACCDGPVRFHRVVNKNYGLQQTAAEAYQRDDANRNAALNKVMNENIRDKLGDENDGRGEVFTCLYCNHTFKSQYCYQKHARRHLNPVSLEAKTAAPKEAKREVKLLDMNVQYYPCKTCGSKFPSYYFVHKHRKLCHAEEMADNGNKNNEMVPEGVTSAESSCSAIDVEAVNAEK
ncbi:hypothetical protein NQ318_015102 [Aromia moschata]|uniref:Uncharacterized protein n=1 Tax=Aromia moschata TaxID=1265417 RepID=A0AAV8YXM5_9CUCU|nr:hypothetical protein NQ318_015102 [Aromia moschata]